MRSLSLLAVSAGAWLALGGLAAAAGVVGTGSAGSCTEAALNTALSGGGSVTFNCGGGPVTIPITSAKTLTTTTTIDGTSQQITLDGGGTSRIFQTTYQFASFTITLRHLTLQHGYGADFGGAIRFVYQDHLTTLVVESCVFADNVAGASGADVGGGAMHTVTGFVVIHDSTFTNNSGGNGGAIGHIQGQYTIEDSVFTGNSTHAQNGGGGAGGAIYTDGSSNGPMVVRRSTFINNHATNAGGAIQTYQYAGASSFTIEDSYFTGNTAVTNGGAIYHQNGALTIRGSTFYANSTIGQGGALWLLQSNPALITNSTFTGNDAIGQAPNNGSTGLGGALLINGSNVVTISHTTIANNHANWVGGGITGGGGSSSTTLRASIVAGNHADNGGNPWNIAHNCSTQLVDGGFNIQYPTHVHPSDPNDPNCASGVSIADPLLLSLADNGGTTPTMGLADASPARDSVTSGCPPPTVDQRGSARPQGAFCDVGAFEAPPPGASVADASVTEGNNGATNAVFTVTLPSASGQTITVAYTTSNGTASAGSDYGTTSGTLTFDPGQTSKPISVPVNGDTAIESDEAFSVDLSSPVNTTLGRAHATGTIVNDDGLVRPERTHLRLGVVRNGGTLVAVTPPQAVAVFVDPGVAWSAAANQPFLSVTPSGVGTGTLTVQVAGTAGLPATGAASATVTITAPAAVNSPQAITVDVQVYAPGTTAPPFGSFDTPANNVTGVTGAVPVTGWALDDVGIDHVELWRSPVSGDPPPAANGRIFIGNAVFVSGARPDVEALYTTSPQAYRAAWGYMLLTNLLPNATTAAPAGGVGTFTLYAYVYDLDGHLTILSPHTLTCDNTAATKPFGTIDTPAQGQTVSGMLDNFGWVLTPGTPTIPIDGSTVQVFVDGLLRGTAQYNLPRNDIETLFPGYTNTAGAIGYFSIDTTQLSNGVHTIFWIVTDDQNRADGIGSRYFTVLN